MDQLSHAALTIALELALFAAVIFAIFGTEDILIDALHIAGFGKRRLPPVDELVPIRGRFAVFIPAWQESTVIGTMLAMASRLWHDKEIRFYIGVYPNDLATLLAAKNAAANDVRIRIVLNHEAGPTTKGACLNRLWQACRADQRSGVFSADFVLLHDAEDCVDAGALALLSEALQTHDYAQIPVVPILNAQSRWIGGHYCDEFAESHLKDMPVRHALGAAIPLAGVGCAFRTDALVNLADRSAPFCADSLTEDYELGLRLSAAGARGTFVRRRTLGGQLVATRSYFPHRINLAVRQKTRWLRGISFDAWDRLGWISQPGSPLFSKLIGHWMLWRDRRAVIAALAILCGYSAIIITVAVLFLSAAPLPNMFAEHPILQLLFIYNLMLLAWRVAVRAACVGHVYGWRCAPLAVLRIPVGNILLVMTAWRAMLGYLRGRRGAAIIWDKTEHHLPVALTIERRK
ncbi:MAG: glycosyl transferase family protein [Sphingopyxis sp.]